MRIRKNPEFVHHRMDSDGVFIDLEYALNCFAHLEVYKNDVYEDANKYHIEDEEDACEHCYDYIVDGIIQQAIITMDKITPGTADINWGKMKGFNKIIGTIGDRYDKYYKSYWYTKKIVELRDSIVYHCSSIIWFSLTDIKGADELALKGKSKSPIIQEHFNDETSRSDDIIVDALRDKIEDMVYSLGRITNKEIEISEINKFIESGFGIETKQEYADWKVKLYNALS